jgi:hypothetical protein
MLPRFGTPTSEIPVQKAETIMIRLTTAICVVTLLTACTEKKTEPTAQQQPVATARPRPPANPLKNVYFGDLHLHTRNSFDAFIFNVRASPDDAYSYAKGGTIKHADGFNLHLNSGPLDFLAVTDHSEYLGVLQAINTPGDPYASVPYAKELFSTDQATARAAFQSFATKALRGGKRLDEFKDLRTVRSAWADTIDAAKRHYDPGKFTTLIAYEYTSAPDGRNLHRNVFFANEKVPELPYTALESQNPEDLWKWLDSQRANGIDSLVIPHNSNGSDGTMFQRTMWNGKPIDRAWAELRQRNEPLVEVTQVKGTSETHPLLSPNDELAGFEVMEWYIGSAKRVTKFDGGYVRQALKDGLEIEQQVGVNPYKYGLVGASDNHNAAGMYEENNEYSQSGILDAKPELRGSVPPKGQTWNDYQVPDGVARYSSFGSSGLTGVWAEENTREAIYGALRRKETFATTGPRIRVRFFAGYGLERVSLASDEGVKAAYAGGVPMGSDLVGKANGKPNFLVMAMRDANSAPLQRIQIVKGWVDSTGKAFEKVFDVACADKGSVDPKTQRCPDNGAMVDVKTCKFSEDKGNAELSATWSDPDFDPKQSAFYYARVIENPTCRWSTWDANRAGVEPSPHLPKTIQERAYTSPIWFVPTKGS